MKFHTLASLATAASVLVVGVAGAQGRAPKLRDICAADIQRMCPDNAGGRGAMKCLKGRMNEVSPGCQSAVQAAKAKRAQRKAARAAAGQSAPTDQGPPPQ